MKLNLTKPVKTKGLPKVNYKQGEQHVGSCQNYGPDLGTLNNRCRIILGTPKKTIILTTTHIYIYMYVFSILHMYIYICVYTVLKLNNTET